MDDQTKNLIQNHINDNDVCLFMKGTRRTTMWVFNGCI